MTDTLLKQADNNYDALSFIAKLCKLIIDGDDKAIDIVGRILALPELSGWKLWVLYSDLCKENLDDVHLLCKNCPDKILLEACSKEDYSGRELVKPYLPKTLILYKQEDKPIKGVIVKGDYSRFHNKWMYCGMYGKDEIADECNLFLAEEHVKNGMTENVQDLATSGNFTHFAFTFFSY